MPRSKKDDPISPSKLEGKSIPDHDGTPVTESHASLTKTGHGFEETMRMAPIHIPMGARIMVLVPARCVSHEYDIVSEGKGAERVELDEHRETAVLEAEGIVFLDPDLVAEVVSTHMGRIAEQRQADKQEAEKAKGINLPPPSGDGAKAK